MRKALFTASALALTLGLSGCLVPEKFDASVNVKPDGSYTYKYDGSAVHYAAAAAIKEKGKLPEKDEAGLKREAEKAAAAPGVKKMAYRGDGRYDVSIDQELKAGEKVRTLSIFNYSRDKDGAYVIAAQKMNDKDRQNLKSLGIKVDGKFEVLLPSNAKVLSNNASSTPGLLSKAYTWKIGGVDDQPSIRFTLGQ